MAVHVGKVLQELFLKTGLKMERFEKGIAYSSKTIYYHFKKEHLNSGILERYESGLKKLGLEVDIWALLSRKSRGLDLFDAARTGQFKEASDVEAMPDASTQRGGDSRTEVAELLRKAAALLERD